MAATVAGLIQPRSITLTRAEGRIEETGKPIMLHKWQHPDIWAAADKVLFDWSSTAPKDGSYHKVDFTVEYEDGKTYTGRYDLVHHTRRYPSLAKHVYEFVRFSAGKWPGALPLNEYAVLMDHKPWKEQTKEFAKFLEKYSIGEFNPQTIKPRTEKQEEALQKLGKYDILQIHDDGDLTVSVGDQKYVVTTEGDIFVHYTPEEALKKIMGKTYVTIEDPGKTIFRKGEVVSPEAFEKENERVKKLGEKEAQGWTSEGEWPHKGNGSGNEELEFLAMAKHRKRDRVAIGDLKVGDSFWDYNSDIEYVIIEPPKEYPDWGKMAHYKNVKTGKPERASAAAWVFRYPPHEWGRGVKIKTQGDIDFLPDSPEYLAQTLETSGWRKRLDQEFELAIQRARSR